MKYELSKISTKHGIFFVYPNDAIAQHIIKNGSWEEHFISTVKNLVKKDDWVIDCGANFGYNSVILGKIIGEHGKLFCFEPQKIIYEQLIKNLDLNGIKNYEAYNNAIDVISEKVVNLNPVNYESSWVNIGDTGIGVGGEKTKTMSLDDLNFERVDFIKLDIQGYELYAMMGGEKTLRKHVPHIFIEIENHQLKRYNLNSDDILNFLKKLNYNIFRIITPSYRDDCICIHESKINCYQKISSIVSLESL